MKNIEAKKKIHSALRSCTMRVKKQDEGFTLIVHDRSAHCDLIVPPHLREAERKATYVRDKGGEY